MSKKTLTLSLASALAERDCRQGRPGYGASWSDKQLEEYIRTVESSLAAMPEDPPLVQAVTDSMIAECMASVSDPLQWGVLSSPETTRQIMREFSHALASRLAASQAPATKGME